MKQQISMKQHSIRQTVCLLLAGMLILTAFACSRSGSSADSPMRTFTDSLGRTVEIPETVERIAVSGGNAQIVVFALAPDTLVGVASEWDASAKAYLDEAYYGLPELGQIYGGKGTLNLETLLQSGAQLVIDVGEPKDDAVEELDALQEQTGLPFVHITMTTETAGDAYRMLGTLLDRTEEAEVLAAYCEDTLKRMQSLTEQVVKKRVLYCLGDQGLHVIGKGSYHAEIIDRMTENAAVLENPSSKGTGNEVDAEQILLWDPDVILFAPDSIYEAVASDEVYATVPAIQRGDYYKVPFGPYNWMGFPPSVQRYLGMLWLGKLLYPDACDYDLYTEVQTYFELFYHCSLSEEQFDQMMDGAI